MLASTLLIVYYTLCRRYARRSLYAPCGQLPNVPYDSSCQVAMDELKTGENDCEGGLRLQWAHHIHERRPFPFRFLGILKAAWASTVWL